MGRLEKSEARATPLFLSAQPLFQTAATAVDETSGRDSCTGVVGSDIISLQMHLTMIQRRLVVADANLRTRDQYSFLFGKCWLH